MSISVEARQFQCIHNISARNEAQIKPTRRIKHISHVTEAPHKTKKIEAIIISAKQHFQNIIPLPHWTIKITQPVKIKDSLRGSLRTIINSIE